MAERQVVSISTAAAPVTKMMAVAGKLWCATLNTVRVLNTATLQVEVSERSCVSVSFLSNFIFTGLSQAYVSRLKSLYHIFL